MVDCSYPGSRPRHYELDKMDSPFSLRVLSDGSYSVAQYNGTNIHVTVPESFNGHKITKIDDEAFMHNIVDVESVELPDSITEIGVNAFTNCKSVKTIRIPKNVKIIERRAFAASGINDIEVDSENPFYTSVDGVVFNKNKTILVAFPAKRGGSYMIPEGVTIIEDYAFAYCEQLQKIEFPMSVRCLKEGAFGSCTSLESVVLKEGLQKIGDYAFIYDKKIDYLVIPKTVKLIGSGAFKGAVYKINVLGQDVQFGEEVISKNSTAIIAGKSESATQKYAQENGFAFIESDSDSVKLDAGWFKEITGQYSYWKNREQTPKVELVSTAPKLDKDEDYTVTYKNNIDAGEATTVIHGMGMFAGTVEKKFIINKYKMYALQDAKFKVSSYSCPDFYATGEPLTPEMVVPGCYIEGEDYEVTYKDNILPGKATVTLTAIGSYTGSCTKNFNIYGDISKQKINTVEDQVYTGKEICPKITVEGLTPGSDYKVYYYNNYAVGQATVSIAGKGYYKGVATINFNIVSPPVSEPANSGTKDNVGVNSPTNKDKKNSSSVSSPLPKKETFSGIVQIEKKLENNMTKKPEKVWVKQIRAHKKALKIIWKKGKNVSGYQVQYSLKRKFTSGVKNVMLTKNTASCTVKKLKTKKTYYVRVRAYRKIGKKRIYSSWSNVKKIKIR